MGLYGTSYPGFYSSASCLSRHPRLVACSPQAPMTDIWMGDDDFHGGAFLLPHNFGFYTGFVAVRALNWALTAYPSRWGRPTRTILPSTWGRLAQAHGSI